MRVSLVNGQHKYHFKSESHYDFQELRVFLNKLVDIFTVLEMKPDQKLPHREKSFFIASVILSMKKLSNPISEESLQIYKKEFKKDTDKVEISNYIRAISKKGWVRYDKQRKILKIPEFFELVRSDRFVMDFEFRMYFERPKFDTA